MIRELNVVVPGEIFIGWGGGVDFIRMVLTGLAMERQSEIVNLHFLLPGNSRVARAKRRTGHVLRSLASLKMPDPSKSFFIDHGSVLDSMKSVSGQFSVMYYDTTPFSLRRALKSVNADILIPSIRVPDWPMPCPWVGYLYDLQHKHYPGFFSAEELAARDRHFEKMLHRSPALIVNAKAVREDCHEFFPQHREKKIFSLPFTPVPSESWFEPHHGNIAEKYGLPRQYFLISNQFWVHKDHRTAFRALKMFHENTGERDIGMVCTGSTEDWRFPGHFAELMADVGRIGLSAKITCLGHIPKLDQIQIMKGSIAVLQPTLFEGGPGGGAVYDAVALGVPAIVSDIPVNREITDGRIEFFRAGDPEDLASKMQSMLERPERDIDGGMQFSLAKERIRRLSNSLVEAIDFVLELR